ncbi:TolC family protein [Marinilabilia salmonicolor]|uniref:Outer membrane protein TolC n=1 Tax=Marinilabilia salmonicolor TaxID=989 RepID=A0A368UZZ2_9BACT|nr:TolC family protein [Marinilabilia salmonicolor]RCW34517.1 outer membrane protein TolC [Marinilabilia salmonicolor]
MPDSMKINKYITIFALLLLTSLTATAQVELNQQKCREMALDYSRQIKISENRHQQAVLSGKIAKAQHLPKLSASGLYFYKPDPLEYSLEGGYLPTYTPGPNGEMQPNVQINPNTGAPVTGPDGNPVFNMYAMMPDMNLNIGLEGVTTAGVQIEQPVYMGGKIRTANKLANTGIEVSKKQMDLKKSEVIANVDAAWFQYLAVKEKHLAANEYKILLDSLKATIEATNREGMATRNELLKVQVKRNEAILLKQKANSGLQLAQMNLCRLIGLPLDTNLIIDAPEETTLPDIQIIEDNNPADRPEYQLLNDAIEAKQYQEKMARAGMLPQIGISAGYSYLGGLKINGQETDEMAFSAMASVKIPIFKWFEEQNKLSKARLETEVARMELEENEKLLQLDIARARFNLEESFTRLQLTEKALEQAQENLETSESLFEEGMEPLVNLLEAQVQWQKAESEYIDAKTSVKLMHTYYLKATGHLSE